MGTFIERVALMNYKSIVQCDVALRPLTVVVGRNGSGKSNFIDSLHFVADALESTLESAIRKRGGIRALIHKRGEQLLGIQLRFKLREGRATYVLEMDRGRVSTESLVIETEQGEAVARYERRGTTVMALAGGAPFAVPPISLDYLALGSLSVSEVFREPYDVLRAMRFYRLDPDAMRQPQDPDHGEVLIKSGANLPSVWGRLNPGVTERLTAYLSAIVPQVTGVRRVPLGTKETLRFVQRQPGKPTLTFDASSMSDGTLLGLGVLVAARQGNGSRPVLICIEEPETALHPGGVAVLLDALHEASIGTQILITSHSADVLDQTDIDKDMLLVTESRDGATVIAEVDTASREAIRRHLYTPGELLRMGQLQPTFAVE